MMFFFTFKVFKWWYSMVFSTEKIYTIY